MVVPPREPAGGAQALGDEHRRTIVRYLLAADGKMALMRLAPRLAGATDTPLPEVLAACHDRHLPALEACGLVTHDAGTVRLDVSPADAEAALEDAAGG